MTIQVVPIYAGILGLLYMTLSAYVIRNRRKRQQSIGHGGDMRFARIIRGHANFAEYVPMVLLLLLVDELLGWPHWVLHALGATLCAGRLLHAYSFALTERDLLRRVGGMVLTLTPMWIAAVLALTGRFVLG